jgi:hypothetical protein
MSVSACGNREIHFSRQDDEDLRNEPTTAAILEKARRDANVALASVASRDPRCSQPSVTFRS